MPETTVGGVLRAAAAGGPDLLAMVGGVPDPGLRRRWTYAGLLAEAEQAARALTARFAPGGAGTAGPAGLTMIAPA